MSWIIYVTSGPLRSLDFPAKTSACVCHESQFTRQSKLSTLLRLKDIERIIVLMLYYISLARQICMFAEYLQGQLIHRGRVAVFVAGSINTSYRWTAA